MSSERLLKGARILGEAWQAGERCSLEWSGLAVDCPCAKKTRFCRARLQWLKIAQESGRTLESGEFGIIISMTGKEWDATGRAVAFETIEAGRVAVGPKGLLTRPEMLKMDPDTLPSTVSILKAFPGSRLEEVVFAKASPPPEDPFEEGEVSATLGATHDA